MSKITSPNHHRPMSTLKELHGDIADAYRLLQAHGYTGAPTSVTGMAQMLLTELAGVRAHLEAFKSTRGQLYQQQQEKITRLTQELAHAEATINATATVGYFRTELRALPPPQVEPTPTAQASDRANTRPMRSYWRPTGSYPDE